LILDLLLKNEFPAVWRRSSEANQILEIMRLRQNLVRQRTQVYNRLQALAHDSGLPKGKMQTVVFQNQLKNCRLSVAGQLQRAQLFDLLAQLDKQIKELEAWLEAQASTNEPVKLLRTQKGVGVLTALCVVNTVGDVTRFSKVGKQVVAFVGLDPVEKSSAGKRRMGGISRAGSSLCRFQLGQAASICARYDTRLKGFVKRLSKKKARGIAKTAAARKLLVKLAIMLRDNITAAEFDRRGVAVGNARIVARSEMTVI
jgi:transposase